MTILCELPGCRVGRESQTNICKSPRSGEWLESKHTRGQPLYGERRWPGSTLPRCQQRSPPVPSSDTQQIYQDTIQEREKNYPKNIRTKHKSVPISTSWEGKLHGTLERSLPQKRGRASAQQCSGPNSHSLKSSCCPGKELGARSKFKNTVGQGGGGACL